MTAANGHDRERVDEPPEGRGDLSFERLFTLSPDMMCVAGLDGHFQRVNPAYARILQWTTDELLAMSLPELIHPDDLADVHHALDLLARGEAVPNAEVRFMRKDGGYVWTEWWAVSAPEERRIYGAGRDISERKRAEVERLRLEAELQQSQKMETIGRFAGGLAHDFNNLLTGIAGYTEFLRRGLAEDDPLRADADEIGKEVERAASLTRQLLAFSRRQSVQQQTLNLNDIVTDMERLLRRLVGTDVELIVMVAPDAGFVDADRSQLEQVVVNLALNARDAMPSGGKLVIETGYITDGEAPANGHFSLDAGDYVTLVVRDTGTGMDPETTAHIFEPFFSTKDVGHGSGLGLSTVFGIIEQSGGRIFVYSERDRGTTFKIYLPRTGEAPIQTAEAAAVKGAEGGNETILLVEDEDVLRALIARTLRAHGYRVITAHYASEAMTLLNSHDRKVDLILSDVVMPGINGVDFAVAIAAERPATRIVLMSGFTDPDAAERLPPASRGGFLEKPFTPERLLHTVRDAIDLKLS